MRDQARDPDYLLSWSGCSSKVEALPMGDVTDFRNVLGAVIDRRAFDLHVNRKKSTVNIATHAGITGRYLEMIEVGTTTPSLPVLRKLDGIRIGLAPLSTSFSEVHCGPTVLREVLEGH